MENMIREGRLKAMNNLRPIILHLIYADDVLIFIKADVKSAYAINEVFTKFDKATSLQINNMKSSTFFRGGCTKKDEICNILEIKEGSLPINILAFHCPILTSNTDFKIFYPWSTRSKTG